MIKYFAIAAVCLVASPVMAQWELVSNYEFNGTYSDSLANGPDMVPIGEPTLSSTDLTFGEPDGISLATNITTGDYRIEMDVTFSSFSFYSKIIDFKDRQLDEGFYVGPLSQFLTFYRGLGTGFTQLLPGTTYTIALEKNATSVSAFLDGDLQFTFTGSEPAVASANSLVFFADDFQVSGEGAVGSVDAIRIYLPQLNDNPVLGAIAGILSYTQNAAPVRIAASATLTDSDSPDFDGGILTVSALAGSNASNRISLLGARYTFDVDNKIYRDGVWIGTRNVGAGIGTRPYVVTFNSSATRAIVQELIRSLAFRTVAGTSTVQRRISLKVTDGDGGTSAPVIRRINVRNPLP